MKPSELLRKAAPIVRGCEFRDWRDYFICNVVEGIDNFGVDSKRVVSYIDKTLGGETFRNDLAYRLDQTDDFDPRNIGDTPESFRMLQWLRAKWCEDMADYFESIGE